MELCRLWDVKPRELTSNIILSHSLRAVYSVVAGLFLLIVPFLQWKGQYLRVSHG